MTKNGIAIHKLDLNLLRVFRSIYYEQNMARAAETLNLTPSAISHALKRLRESLNDPLFERREGKMQPTVVCRRLASEVINSLTQLEQLLQEWGEFDAETSKHSFRIGMHSALELSVLPPLLEEIGRHAPKVTISSVKLTRPSLATDLASGKLDVALDVVLPISEGVASTRLIKNKFVVLLRSDHPFNVKPNKNSYLKSKHIVVSNRRSGASMEDVQLTSVGLSRQITIRCQSYIAAREAIHRTGVMLTLPQNLAEQFIEPGLSICELPIKLPGYATQLYWHKSTSSDPALIWLREQVTSIFKPSPS